MAIQGHESAQIAVIRRATGRGNPVAPRGADAHRRLAPVRNQPRRRPCGARGLQNKVPADPRTRAQDIADIRRDKNFEREAVTTSGALMPRLASVRGNVARSRRPRSREPPDARCFGEFKVVERGKNHRRVQFLTAKTIGRRAGNRASRCRGQNQVEPVLSRQQAIALPMSNAFEPAQKSVVEDVLSSSDHISGASGIRRQWQNCISLRGPHAAESRGYMVRGFARLRAAARQLGDAGVESRDAAKVSCSFLVDAQCASPAGTLLTLSMNRVWRGQSIRCAISLRGLGRRIGVLLIGDIRSIQGVEAGAPSSRCRKPDAHGQAR